VILPWARHRDKYLAPDGILLPDKATLYLSAIEDGATHTHTEREGER
jgi:hypothetical protein